MITFYIHTLGRPLAQSTLGYLRQGGVSPLLVVQPQEARIYRQRWPNEDFLVLPEKIKGLSPTRQYLLETCETRFVVLCDDDLRFSRKRPEDRSKLREPEGDDMKDMISMMMSKLQRFPHVGISAREGNNRKPDSFYYNERMMRVLAYDKEKVPWTCRFDRVPCKQDFDMTLQLLRAGKKNCVIYEFAQDQVGGSNAKGGCATYRTEQMADQAAVMLKELHPDFVTLVEKSNSNWKGFSQASRKEVMVQWKKAYEAGRAGAGAVS